MSRVDDVRLLLESMHWYVPSFKLGTSNLASSEGPQASSYTICETCRGAGRTIQFGNPCPRCLQHRAKRPNHGCRMCPSCEGTGEVKKRRRAGDDYDTMLGTHLSDFEEQIARAPLSRSQQKMGRVVLQVESEPEGLERWQRERERYYQAGSYGDLDRQLRWLSERWPLRYEGLQHWASSIDDPIWHWSQEALASIEATIQMLAERMVPPVKVPSWVVRADRRRKARQAGTLLP